MPSAYIRQTTVLRCVHAARDALEEMVSASTMVSATEWIVLEAQIEKQRAVVSSLELLARSIGMEEKEGSR